MWVAQCSQRSVGAPPNSSRASCGCLFAMTTSALTGSKSSQTFPQEPELQMPHDEFLKIIAHVFPSNTAKSPKMVPVAQLDRPCTNRSQAPPKSRQYNSKPRSHAEPKPSSTDYVQNTHTTTAISKPFYPIKKHLNPIKSYYILLNPILLNPKA